MVRNTCILQVFMTHILHESHALGLFIYWENQVHENRAEVLIGFESSPKMFSWMSIWWTARSHSAASLLGSTCDHKIHNAIEVPPPMQSTVFPEWNYAPNCQEKSPQLFPTL